MRTFLLMLTMLSAYSSIAQIQAFDCEKAIKICSKEPLIIDYLSGAGENSFEVTSTNCFSEDFPETNSTWITWKIQEGGTMEFSIIPKDQKDDFDFVLYKNTVSENSCSSNAEIRCSASGENLGEMHDASEPTNNCLGIIGLRMGAGDNSEYQGCSSENDNFLEAINTEEGDVYTIFINNYSSSNGFAFELTGTSELDPTINDCFGDVSGTGFLSNDEIMVSEIYPNPAISKIVTDVRIPTQTQGEILVFNSSGQIKYQEDRLFVPGDQILSVDVSDYTPGVYFMKIKIGEYTWLSDFSKQQ